jgi:DEAD/DEAH box helicase domain-containing protein
MSRILYFDLETKYAAEEVGGWNNVWDMGMSVGVVWDTFDRGFHVYLEHQVPALVNHLRQGNLIVGFNHVEFDYKVVAGDQPAPESRHKLYVELAGLHNFDMLAELKKILNHRLKLDSIARPTLQEGKSADGLQALEWYKQGRMDLIIAYCKQDVDVTRRIYEYAVEKGHLLYESRTGIKTVPLTWTAPALTPKAPSNPGE